VDLRQRLLLHRQAGFDVEVRGLGAFVAEIKSNHFCGDIGFQQSHGGPVSERMGRDAALLKRWNLGRRALDELLKLIGCTRPGEPLAEAIGQQGSLCNWAVILEPPS